MTRTIQSRKALILQIQAIRRYQEEIAAEGLMPDGELLLLRKYRVHLQCAGAPLIGLLIAMATLVFNFIVFNWVLHVAF